MTSNEEPPVEPEAKPTRRRPIKWLAVNHWMGVPLGWCAECTSTTEHCHKRPGEWR